MPSLPSKKQRTKTRKQLLAAEALLLLLLRRAARKDGKGSITQALYRGKQELRQLGRKSVEDELETEITQKPTPSARRDLASAAKVSAGFLAFAKSRTKALRDQTETAESALLNQQATAAVDNRLRQIAAFEAVRAFEEERRDAAEQISEESGRVMAKRWDASLDSLTCTTCEGLDGREAELDEEFPDGDPPLHPNCRCSIEYRFDT